MADIKIKKEEYAKRIKELEQEESSANSAEERKKIARKRRYFENKLFRLLLPVEHRQDYTVKIRFVFEGEAKVYATSKEEAKQIVKDSLGMSCGQINASAPNILDWDIDMKPNKIVQ